ncbi:hypothetical protein [Pseudomonas sp.]|uniref:hypothetical protein n=1 Tax=Pseudomonas sp. TaxID=306 RepID=UPI003265CE3A
MHSLFFANDHVFNGRLQPLDSIENPDCNGVLSLEWQARLAIAFSLCTLGGCAVLWLIAG